MGLGWSGFSWSKLVGEHSPRRKEEHDGKSSVGIAVGAALPLALVKRHFRPWRPLGGVAVFHIARGSESVHICIYKDYFK